MRITNLTLGGDFENRTAELTTECGTNGKPHVLVGYWDGDGKSGSAVGYKVRVLSRDDVDDYPALAEAATEIDSWLSGGAGHSDMHRSTDVAKRICEIMRLIKAFKL